LGWIPASVSARDIRSLASAFAAAGHSNREIAQALFVTTKTVEMHLSNVYRKLDIDSREQLPSALGADGAAQGSA
jgi:DNA-binding NarL/FixJ family response regulator